MSREQELTFELMKITDNYVYPEYYSHTEKIMWKIDNQYTKYRKDTIVLCSVEGSTSLSDALFLAIKKIKARKEEFMKAEENAQ